MKHISKQLKPLRKRLRRLFKLNHRKIIWIFFICLTVLAGVYKQHKLDAYNYRLEINKNLYETREELYKAFETVDGQKNDLQKKSEQVKALERRIEKLEADLQAKREQQSLIAKIVSPKVYAESNYDAGSVQAKVFAAGGEALVNIVRVESGFNPYAVNTSSGACGLFQRLPCSVTLGDVDGQIRDGLAYCNARYGSPEGAWSFWTSHHWY